MRAVLLMLCGLLAALPAAAGTVSGFVRDAEDGEALIGASVYLEGEELGGSSNISGYYVVTGIPAGDYTLVCSFIGYAAARQEIRVEEGADLKVDLSLRSEAVGLEEVVVRADSLRTAEKLFRKPVSEIKLSGRQISQIPQVAEADLLRSLQTLPGILPLSDFSSALYVRGGTPDQNLYMIDGTDVYNPEHAFGLFSTFNSDAIKQVELSKGGYGAEYGGRLSSVLDVTNLDGNREEFEGKAAISLLSAKTTLQMPLGKKGSLSGSARRTYFDQTVARALDDIPDYYFYDGNIKAYFELDANNKITLSGYGGRDFLDVVFNESADDDTGISTDWGNKTGSVRWTRVFSPQLFGNFWVTGSRFTSDFTFEEIDIFERNLVTDTTFKGNFEYIRSSRLSGKFGFEQKNLHVKFRQDFPGGLVDVSTRPTQYTLYGLASWRPSAFWDVEAGLRYNVFDSERTFHNLAPRLALKYRLSETTSLKAAGGVYYHYLHRVPRFFATDIWTTSNDFQDASRSEHLVLGVQREVAGNYQFEVEGYLKTYSDIYAFNQTFLTELEETGFNEANEPIFTNTRGIFNSGEGASVGVEALLRKDSGAISGWVGYSLAQTEYKFPTINLGRDFYPRHDRTSTFNLVGNIDIKNAWRKARGRPKQTDRGRWTFGVNAVYSTGQPFTEPGSGYFARPDRQRFDQFGNPDFSLAYAPTKINNIRLPHYARLDLSLTYRRQFETWSIAPYIQFFNAGNRKNVWFVNYDFKNGLPDVDTTSMFPLLPTIGVNLEF